MCVGFSSCLSFADGEFSLCLYGLELMLMTVKPNMYVREHAGAYWMAEWGASFCLFIFTLRKLVSCSTLLISASPTSAFCIDFTV